MSNYELCINCKHIIIKHPERHRYLPSRWECRKAETRNVVSGTLSYGSCVGIRKDNLPKCPLGEYRDAE